MRLFSKNIYANLSVCVKIIMTWHEVLRHEHTYLIECDESILHHFLQSNYTSLLYIGPHLPEVASSIYCGFLHRDFWLTATSWHSSICPGGSLITIKDACWGRPQRVLDTNTKTDLWVETPGGDSKYWPQTRTPHYK